MLGRLAVVAVLLASAPAAASQAIAIHATCAAQVAADPTHVRTLRDELAQAIREIPAGYTVDVSLVRLDVTRVRTNQLEIRAEVRAILSDAQGRMRWAASTRTLASGRSKDRALLQRDAISGAARQLGKQLAAR